MIENHTRHNRSLVKKKTCSSHVTNSQLERRPIYSGFNFAHFMNYIYIYKEI